MAMNEEVPEVGRTGTFLVDSMSVPPGATKSYKGLLEWLQWMFSETLRQVQETTNNFLPH